MTGPRYLPAAEARRAYSVVYRALSTEAATLHFLALVSAGEDIRPADFLTLQQESRLKKYMELTTERQRENMSVLMNYYSLLRLARFMEQDNNHQLPPEALPPDMRAMQLYYWPDRDAITTAAHDLLAALSDDEITEWENSGGILCL